MIKLTDELLLELSEALDVPYEIIQKLYSMRMLHEPTTFSVLMKHDYDRLRKMGKYRPGQVILAVANKYHVTTDRVRNAIYSKNRRLYYCEECGKRIPHREYLRGFGKCDDCFVKTIEI